MADEYIKKDSALKEISDACDRCGYLNDKFANCMCCIVPNLKSYLREIPAADVVPVRHGRWVKAKGAWCTPGGDPVWECSECGKGIHVYGIECGTYGASVADGQWIACPNCGARMEVSHE